MTAAIPDFRTRMVGSITAGSAALIAGVGVATPIIAGAVTEIAWGRPTSTSGLAFPAAIFLGLLGAALGAALGSMVETFVRNSPRAGRVDWRLAGVLLLVVAAVPSAFVVNSKLRQEALNTPRVILSSEEIVAIPGESSQQPIASPTLLWRMSEKTEAVRTLRWNGQLVDVALSDRKLEVGAAGLRGDAVSLADFDYVREIYGVTATMTSDRAEFLALLLNLRSSGHRSLLLMFNSRGTLVHQELLLRRSGNPTLFAAGRPGYQEISVNVDLQPMHYSAAPR